MRSSPVIHSSKPRQFSLLVIFPNKIYAERYNLISDKNIYLGNTKFDGIPEKDVIYDKYKLNKNIYSLII